MRILAAVALLLSSAQFESAATSTAWQISGFGDFTKGKLSGLSVSADGILQLGPSTRFSVPLNQPAAWGIAPAPDGGVFVATGHSGKILHVTTNGQSSVVWSSPQPEIFALAAGPGNSLYAGTSPNGALYRIEGGNAQLIWRSPAKYIWTLAVATDGSILVGTGEQGRVYRVASDGTADVYYDTGQSNVTALALRPDGNLLAGTDPNGLLYEISGLGKGTILYDSSLPEIRSIVVAPDGTLYVAAMGGGLSTRTSAAAAPQQAASAATVSAVAPTVVTVTEAAGSNTDQTAVTSQTPAASSISSATAPAGQAAAVVEVSGVDKSAIYRITRDRAVDTLRTSKEENVYDLLLDGNALLFGTDVRGRVYRLEAHRTTLLSELADGGITRIMHSGDALYAVMSNPGRLFALGPPGVNEGSYDSQVHDAGSVARWGHLQVHASAADVSFQTRTGWSARPDTTWSDWSPIDSATSLIKSPSARFIQFRAQWPAGSAAAVDSIDVPFLAQNGPPVVHSITVTSILGQNAAKSSTPSTAAASTAYSITVTDTGEAPAASTGSSASQVASHLQSTQTQISWQADDPDNDKLAYSVYFRAENEKTWQLVRSHMFENTLLLDPDVFADGRYFFRVVATDSPSNAPEFAHESELVSTPVLIDNTPPVVTLSDPQRNGSSVDVDVKAADQTSPLRLCEYSLDAGSWQPIEAVDGVTDSPRQSFHLHLDNVRPGEHLLVFRVYDTANNAGLAKTIVR